VDSVCQFLKKFFAKSRGQQGLSSYLRFIFEGKYIRTKGILKYYGQFLEGISSDQKGGVGTALPKKTNSVWPNTKSCRAVGCSEKLITALSKRWNVFVTSSKSVESKKMSPDAVPMTTETSESSGWSRTGSETRAAMRPNSAERESQRQIEPSSEHEMKNAPTSQVEETARLCGELRFGSPRWQKPPSQYHPLATNKRSRTCHQQKDPTFPTKELSLRALLKVFSRLEASDAIW
jgi:hypothetical protein